MKMRKFKVKFKDTLLVGDILSKDDKIDLLIMHGAGNSNRKRFKKLREALFQKGIFSCAFDFIGHGETGGQLTGSTLKERTEQAEEIIKHLKSIPSSILGSSMSAYTAIKLLEKFNIKNLILQVPAVYANEEYEEPFGPKFSGEIRKNKSWKNSDAFDILTTFLGNILIITAELDEVIPKELTNQIFSSAINSLSKELYQISGAPHSMNGFIANNPELLKTVSKKINKFIK